jgi:hypothetical protein
MWAGVPAIHVRGVFPPETNMSTAKYLPLLGVLWVITIVGACAEGTSDPPVGAGGEGGMGGCDAAAPDVCNGTCVDLNSDPENCGECDHSCGPIDYCQDGECVDCDPGLFACDNVCIDISNDPDNCGACGKACDEGLTCEGYQCRCLDDKTLCGDECVVLESDPDHCGGCDNACDDGEVCFNSACDTDCGALLECGRECVDPLTSDDHCGFCNHACAMSEDCVGGMCQCIPGLCGACGVVDVGSTVPQTVSGNTTGAPDALSPSCSSGGGDKAYLFTAPSTATYAFVVSTGGFFSPVLTVRDTGTCGELACATDSGFFGQAQLIYDLTAGEQIMIGVEGSFGGSGNFQLQISEAPPCPAIVLSSTLPQIAMGNNAAVPDIVDASCAFGADGGEITYEFTAPMAGNYVFAVETGFSFQPVVEVRSGTCAGAVLGCDEGWPGAATAVNLSAGQTVVVVVDSYFGGGNFTLTVDLAPPCPAIALPSSVPQTIMDDNSGSVDQFTPYCYASGQGEDTFSFTAPSAGSYAISVDTAFSFEPVIDIRNGSCIGGSLACDFGGYSQAVQVDLAAGQSIVIAVDSTYNGGPYTMDIQSAPPCPEIPLSGSLPITVSGDNTGAPNLQDPSCASFFNANEQTYSFTAPAAGVYAFSVDTMFFGAIVEVRNGSCAGAPLSCVSNFGITTATATLAAGQTVVVVVDSDGGTGPYDLTVDVAPPCPGVNLGSTTPQTVMGTTSGASFYSGNCSFGSQSSPEDSFLFTAPANGTYTFDTLGSAFDTVLYLHTIDCGGAEITCNDDDFTSMTAQSKVTRSLLAGEMVAIFVDGNYGDQGNYVLNVSGP